LPLRPFGLALLGSPVISSWLCGGLASPLLLERNTVASFVFSFFLVCVGVLLVFGLCLLVSRPDWWLK